MALSQSALLEVLDALKAGESVEMIRDAVQVILQELIEAEATAVIGAERHQRTVSPRVQWRLATDALTVVAAGL
jgi:putative transposase